MDLQAIKELYTQPLLDLVFQAAATHRQFHEPNEIQVCHLISIKTGGCPEDCKYCSQSHKNALMKPQPMMKKEEVMERVEQAIKGGVTRICLGAAWREVRLSPQFDQILEIIKEIAAKGVEVCCTLGMLSEEAAKRLKEAGLYSYNHNLDTSPEYYKMIVTTRTYADRIKTLDTVHKTGLNSCCGGIIGLGESQEDRISLLHVLSNRNPHPDSVPINLLSPVPGTPLENQLPIDTVELIRMVASARLLMPTAIVRLSAGRVTLTPSEQALCFLAGVNSIHAGEKLLTVGNPGWEADNKMLKSFGLVKRPSYKACK